MCHDRRGHVTLDGIYFGTHKEPDPIEITAKYEADFTAAALGHILQRWGLEKIDVFVTL